MQKITFGLSVHRPEMIPFIADGMQDQDAIFLEEPPTDGFQKMLAGVMGVDNYLRPLDVEFPVFSRDMCYLLRELKKKGKKYFKWNPIWKFFWVFMNFLLEVTALRNYTRIRFSIRYTWPSGMQPALFWPIIKLS